MVLTPYLYYLENSTIPFWAISVPSRISKTAKDIKISYTLKDAVLKELVYVSIRVKISRIAMSQEKCFMVIILLFSEGLLRINEVFTYKEQR